jgi:hypothetical protein
MAYRFGRLFETEGKRRSNRGPKAAELSGNLRCRAPALSTSVVSAPASKQPFLLCHSVSVSSLASVLVSPVSFSFQRRAFSVASRSTDGAPALTFAASAEIVLLAAITLMSALLCAPIRIRTSFVYLSSPVYISAPKAIQR